MKQNLLHPKWAIFCLLKFLTEGLTWKILELYHVGRASQLNIVRKKWICCKKCRLKHKTPALKSFFYQSFPVQSKTVAHHTMTEVVAKKNLSLLLNSTSQIFLILTAPYISRALLAFNCCRIRYQMGEFCNNKDVLLCTNCTILNGITSF